jgi:hypothetical protein
VAIVAQERINIEKLNRIYDDAEAADRELLAEMRTNVLLVGGEHYPRKGTKNHIHKITRHYVANIATYAPGVTVLPQRESERQDQKAADLNKSIWEDAKSRYKLRAKRRKWRRDFVEIGEACVKVFWDPNGGELLGYEQ